MSKHLVLLTVHAHPDDESLGTGGILARYASEGVETILVCATRGEAGEVLNTDFPTEEIPSDFAELRLKELEAACGILGVHRTHLLGYRDSGMEGRDSNAHPDALVNADLREATERLVRIIREARPHVVVTYNEKGFYGHPDHIAVNRITVAALAASGDPQEYAHLSSPPWRPKKLYYTAIPRSRLIIFKQYLEGKGEEFEIDVDLLGTPDEAITTWIDVSSSLDQKLRAIKSHRSQIGPNHFVNLMDEPTRREVFSTECFVCVHGCKGGPLPEDDLFQGIRNRDL
jgi:N-acetyl-1-D-myo-inositol-2-amino-2-deoxy-alpha-D-glucopyranoside deacetylase